MRHIPSSDTCHVRVLSFEDALKPTSADFDRDRWIYVPDYYSEYRYLLGTRGRHPLVCIGINPSTAVPGMLDNTLKSVERIALHNGYDSFVMFNVYAQRATNPDDMERKINPRLHQENMKAFSWLLSSVRSPVDLWAAWGAIMFTAGPRSRAGHPHHPLYLRKDSVLDPFTDLESYLHTLSKPNGGPHV